MTPPVLANAEHREMAVFLISVGYVWKYNLSIQKKIDLKLLNHINNEFYFRCDDVHRIKRKWDEKFAYHSQRGYHSCFFWNIFVVIHRFFMFVWINMILNGPNKRNTCWDEHNY